MKGIKIYLDETNELKPLTKKNKVNEIVAILFIIHSTNVFVNSKLI